MTIDKKTLFKVFVGVVFCIFLYWLLHETNRVKAVWDFLSGMFSPFFAGAALAFVLNVPMRGIESRLGFIKRRGLRHTASIALTFVAVALVLYFVVILLIPQITDTIQTLLERLPVFFGKVYDKGREFFENNPDVLEWIDANSKLETFNWSSLLEKGMKVVGDGLSKVLSQAFTAIGSVSSAIFNGVISLVFAIYCLARKEILARQGRRLLYAFLPEKFCDNTIRILRLTNKSFSNFISGQCLEAVILGCMFAVSMLIFKMPYIPLVSVLIAVTALVPIVGAFVGCFFGAFFILVNDPMQAVWFVVMFLVLQQIEGNLIYPKVVGSSVGLPGMWVLLAVSVGGELMGVVGMMLMIPLFSVLYTILRELTRIQLEKRGIPQEKLMDQPPELRRRLRESRKKAKLRRENKKKSKSEEVTE